MIVNHVGLRVRDLEASSRFYEALGFREVLAIDPPDEASSHLLRVPAPVGLRAVYLTNDSFVLELLDYSGHPGSRVERSMTDTGLTHLSIGVDDVARAKAVVDQSGGEILDDTDMGVAVMVRDPDGQLIELLDVSRRPVAPAEQVVLDAIWSQRACRRYLDDPIPADDLAAMIKSASHAPSAENTQPWIFVVVDDAEVRDRVDELTRSLWRQGGRAYSEASLSPRFFEEVDAFMDGGYGGAPCLIVVAGDGRGGASKALLAASVFPATQNLLLSAAALGYGSSMTTLAAQASDELSEILGLPEGVVPFAVVPVGRSARRLGPPKRRPVDQIAHRNRFGRPFG